MLKTFSTFRQKYLSIHNDIDFPNNRLIFCAPEIAFPVLYGLAEFWNSNPYFHKKFGCVSVYPVERNNPHVHDSILNFWEMWKNGTPSVGKDLIGTQETFYFEINEDFNLNLKLESEILTGDLRDEVWRRLNNVKWSKDIKTRCRNYKQTTFVLFEWDFGFLEYCDNYKVVADNLFSILEETINALA